jgi:hypothetical protein
MDQPHRRGARSGANRDGLAALAIVLLAAVLIALAINNFV